MKTENTCIHGRDWKYYNMKTQIFEDELYYICHDGRELHHIRTEKKNRLVIHKPLRCMDVPIAVAADIKKMSL